MTSSACMAPLFKYAGDSNFDQDFDIGLLSEYLFEDEKYMPQSKQGQNNNSSSSSDPLYASSSDYMNFGNDDGLNFENDDDDDGKYNCYDNY